MSAVMFLSIPPDASSTLSLLVFESVPVVSDEVPPQPASIDTDIAEINRIDINFFVRFFILIPPINK